METFRWAGWRDEAKKKWWEAGWTKPMLDPQTSSLFRQSAQTEN